MITKSEILKKGWVESLPEFLMVTTGGIPKYYVYVKQKGKRITIYKMTIGGALMCNKTLKIQIKRDIIFKGTLSGAEDLNKLMMMLRIIPYGV